MNRFSTCLATATLLAVVSPASAGFIGGLDGSSAASTFTAGATTPLPTLGWEEEIGDSRVFLNGSGAGVLIADGDATGLYSAIFDTGTAFVAQSTYDLTVVLGAVTPTPGDADYTFALGYIDNNTFVAVATDNDSVTGADLGGEVQGDGSNTSTDALTYVADASVAGQDIVVRIGRTGGDGRWFGFDAVTLNETPVPEPGSLALVALGSLVVLRRRR